MKKIAILTFHNACNYGAFLQAKALSEYIGKLPDVKVFVLNYKNKNVENNYSIKGIFSSSQSLKSKFLKIARIKDIVKRNKIFRQYQTETFNLIDLEKLRNENFDKVVVGSDQVWNMRLTGGDLNYFLPFVQPECRVPYAASAGQVNENIDKNTIKEKLKNFSAISVREQGLSDLINELAIGRKAAICIDPVFLKTKYEWESYAKTSKEFINSPYILAFIMGVSKKADEVVNCALKYGLKTGNKVLLVADQERWYKYRNIKHYGVANPREFISLIAGASCVFTNSFHATAFSIILNSPFYTEINIQNSERVKYLLNVVGLESRAMYDGNLSSPYTTEINWECVMYKLSPEIEKSKKFLDSVVLKMRG